MSSEWKTFVLRDVASIIGGGTPSTKEATYWDGNIPWLTPKDLSSHTGMYVKRGERSITKAGLDGSSAKIVPPGTVLFTSRAPIGYLAIAEQAISTNQGFKSLVLNTEQDNRFFYYLLRFHTPDIEAIATGSTFKEISGSALGSFEVTIPSYGEQTKIADILTTLDDRIELLRETNATLEAIAQALFKSWFVDFDPVRAKQEGREPEGMDADTAALFPDSFEESELGLIPKGWNWSTMDSISTVGIGKTPPRKEPQWFSENNKDERWVSIRDMGISGVFISQTSEYLTAESIDRFNVRIIPGNTVLLSFKMTIGRVSLTVGKMTSNEAIAHFKLDEKSPLTSEYIYLYLKQFKYSTLSSTSSIADAVNSKTVKNIPILVADQSILKAFQNNVSAIFYRIKVIEEQSQTLTAIRDTLLPRLISGQLRIPEAEALIEETTA